MIRDLLNRFDEQLQRHGATRVPLRTIKGFMADDCITFAASISFYFLLSFIPFLILLGALTGHIIEVLRVLRELSQQEMAHQITEYVQFAIPYITEEYVAQFLSISGYSLEMGIIGSFTMIITATLLFSSLQRTFFNIFGGRKMGFFVKRLMGVVFIVTLTVLLFFLHYLLIILGSFTAFVDDSIPVLGALISTIGSNNALVSFVSTTIIIILLFEILLFYFTVGVNRQLRAVIIGGTLFSVLWNVVRWGFDIYLTKMSGISVIYGSATWLVTTVLWVYYSSILFLFSMEFIKELYRFFESGRSSEQ